uniref:Uncharacterized protein n=1 Tax=Solanum tuberosum TaxID=4113 RepID=M1DQZ0_SOLTU
MRCGFHECEVQLLRPPRLQSRLREHGGEVTRPFTNMNNLREHGQAPRMQKRHQTSAIQQNIKTQKFTEWTIGSRLKSHAHKLDTLPNLPRHYGLNETFET